jgi:cytochrome b involved in lipid metabolism
MNKTALFSIIGIIILALIGWVGYNYVRYTPGTYVQETVNTDGTTTTTTVNTDTGTTTPGAPALTMATIGAHASASSCYTVISGKVYDLTMWVNLHPGGRAAILSLCGKDGTAPFMNQHHGAQKQMDILARYYIGNLSQ